VNDRRIDADGQRCKFTSGILPPYMRRSPKVAEVLPVLYLLTRSDLLEDSDRVSESIPRVRMQRSTQRLPR
jgi:hypothetical protein